VSLRDQSYARFEVVVVNGPSVDGTSQLLRQFGDSARVLACDVAILGISRNVGLDASSGDIVAFLDDDAIPEDRWLEGLVKEFVDDSVDAVGGPVFDVPLGRIEWRVCTCTRLGEPNVDTPRPFDCYVGIGADPFQYLAGCNMSFRRDALTRIGGFNSLLSANYDDAEVCCRLVDAGFSIRYTSEALVRHFRAPSAIRDESQRVRDPYAMVVCRSIFARQTGTTCSESAIDDEITQWAAGWGASIEADPGNLTPEEVAWFKARLVAGVADGRRLGSTRRPFHRVPAARPTEFRLYVLRSRSNGR
jgi:glycosyltransferase involved in cell wall biosynthesis